MAMKKFYIFEVLYLENPTPFLVAALISDRNTSYEQAHNEGFSNLISNHDDNIINATHLKREAFIDDRCGNEFEVISYCDRKERICKSYYIIINKPQPSAMKIVDRLKATMRQSRRSYTTQIIGGQKADQIYLMARSLAPAKPESAPNSKTVRVLRIVK